MNNRSIVRAWALGLCTMSFAVVAQAGTFVWEGDTESSPGSGVYHWSTGGNWTNNTAPGAADTAVFPTSGLNKTVTLDAPGFVRALDIRENGYVIGGAAMTLTDGSGKGIVVADGKTTVVECIVTNAAGSAVCSLTPGLGARLELNGAFHMAAHVTAYAAGTLSLGGTANNTASAGTFFTGNVPGGSYALTLELRKQGGAIAIPVNLSMNGNSTSRWFAAEQVANTKDPSLNDAAFVDLNGFTETMNTLEIQGNVCTSKIDLKGGRLGIGFLQAWTTDDPQRDILDSVGGGALVFTGGRKVQVANGPSVYDLNISAIIEGTGWFDKTFGGVLRLTGANTFSGGIGVKNGTLWVSNTSGSGSGTGNVTAGPDTSDPAILGGLGTLNSKVILRGNNATVRASLAPGEVAGSGNGTLTIQKDVEVESYSTLALDLAKTGVSDSLNIAAPGTLKFIAAKTDRRLVLNAPSGLASSETYTLATFTSRNGTFDAVYYNGTLVATPTSSNAVGETHRLEYGDTSIRLIPSANGTIITVQ